jgi:hypothetical protein
VYWNNNALIYSPADICRFMTSPFASWMERYAIDQPHVPYEYQVD